jgi:epoxyqueuosine reductase
MIMNLVDSIKQKARRLGLDLVGITDAAPIGDRDTELFKDWLNLGFAGQMTYMHRNLEKRINPAKILKNAQSVICVGLNYKAPEKQQTLVAEPSGRVAAYAQFEDYHGFIKNKLFKLAEFIKSSVKENHKFKICVDSAPVAERTLAARAGLGFIGKNHILINPDIGPQILLGQIITTLKLAPDKPVKNMCSDCNKCIKACPTGALQPDGRLDANLCISYLTIEYKGPVSESISPRLDDHLFGCDECMLACPFAEKGTPRRRGDFKFYFDRNRLNLQKILDLSEEDFGAQFSDSTIRRTGLDRLKRNAGICLANRSRPFEVVET